MMRVLLLVCLGHIRGPLFQILGLSGDKSGPRPSLRLWLSEMREEVKGAAERQWGLRHRQLDGSGSSAIITYTRSGCLKAQTPPGACYITPRQTNTANAFSYVPEGQTPPTHHLPPSLPLYPLSIHNSWLRTAKLLPVWQRVLARHRCVYTARTSSVIHRAASF